MPGVLCKRTAGIATPNIIATAKSEKPAAGHWQSDRLTQALQQQIADGARDRSLLGFLR
jgi:hypothetical protein